MQSIVAFANEYWNLWLLIIFVGIVVWAIWPTKARNQQMKHAANIPFEDDDFDAGKGDK